MGSPHSDAGLCAPHRAPALLTPHVPHEQAGGLDDTLSRPPAFPWCAIHTQKAGARGTRASPPRAWPRAASGGRASLVWRVGRVIASGQQRGGVSEEVLGEGGEQSDARDVREAAHEHLRWEARIPMRACVRLVVPRLCSRHTCPTSKPGGSMTPPAHPGCLCRVAPPVTRRGPHGPGRADFPHPVLRAAASSRFEACASPRTSPATRVARLSARGCEWLVSTMSLPSGPARARMPRRRPLLRGVPWVGSPTSSLVLRRYDSSTPRPPSLCLERPFRLSG